MRVTEFRFVFYNIYDSLLQKITTFNPSYQLKKVTH